ncbi:MAG: type II secretion system protein [Elusimicrobiota bacterium]
MRAPFPGRTEPSRAGYTMVELMIVLAIIAILMSIMAPKFGTMIRRANEGATRGKLGSIRSALTVYYADMEGVFPFDLNPLMQPGSKYLTKVVPLYTAEHGSAITINYSDDIDFSIDNGGWGYVNSGGRWGTLWVACTHTDLKGNEWTSY